MTSSAATSTDLPATVARPVAGSVVTVARIAPDGLVVITRALFTYVDRHNRAPRYSAIEPCGRIVGRVNPDTTYAYRDAEYLFGCDGLRRWGDWTTALRYPVCAVVRA